MHYPSMQNLVEDYRYFFQHKDSFGKVYDRVGQDYCNVCKYQKDVAAWEEYAMQTSVHDHCSRGLSSKNSLTLRASNSARCRLPFAFIPAAAASILRRVISCLKGGCRHSFCDDSAVSNISNLDVWRKRRVSSSTFSMVKTGSIWGNGSLSSHI